jgi:ribosomal protein L37AE/L43A
MIAQGEEWPTCPDCHQPLERRVGRDDDTAIWVVRCHVCGRGIVMTIAGERPENHPANAS